MKTKIRVLIPLAIAITATLHPATAADSLTYLSHAPLRSLPPIAARPAAAGSARYVDANRGDDSTEGSEKSPWKSIRHALTQLAPGDTLYLRGGVFYENVSCSLAGTAEKPITIRSAPGERAIIDGGFREFLDAPAKAWVPAEGGAPDEFRSARPYRNITGVSGMFGDSAIGLHTYWLLGDLRATNEHWQMNPDKKIFDLAIYCGPGLWYDDATGYIHCRLAHTHNDLALTDDYRGETDPRKLPLVIAPINSVPLHFDHARNIRVQDLVLRGGGEECLLVQYSSGIEMDGVIVQCGRLTGQHSGPVKFTHSAIHGRVPPWMWRIDSSQGCASGAARDVVRLVTPTLVEMSHDLDPVAIPRAVQDEMQAGQPAGRKTPPFEGEDARSPQMIHYPQNHDWEFSWSEFTDGHDGVFLAGRSIQFHHNLVENIQDDALDLSCALPRVDDSMFITQNLVRHCLTAISTHFYNVQWPRGRAFIARNIIDQSLPVMFNRPTETHPEGDLNSVGTFLLHGSDHAQFIESVTFCQNTCLAPTSGNYAFAHRTMFHLKAGSERRVFNNIFVYLNDTGLYPPPFYGMNVTNLDLQIDGNLHWNPHPAAKAPAGYLETLRKHPLSEFNKVNYPPGFGANDLVSNPGFVAYEPGPRAANDYRLANGSAAIGKGVILPADWPDPLRPANGVRPDIGALPAGSEPPKFGIHGRVGFEALVPRTAAIDPR